MDILGIDLGTATLAGLAVIGAVNVATIFRPTLDSKTKFLISLVVAFIIGFIPAELGSVILTRAKDAIAIAFAASGGYKLFQVTGGTVVKKVV